MSLGQDIVVSFLGHLWEFVKDELEIHRVSRKTPEQLEKWCTEEFAKIHKQAVKLAGFTTDKELRKQGLERAGLVRVYEVISRNDLGVRMSQKLLEGMEIRGLDLRKVRGLNQQQIDLAIGDHTTLLPDYLQVPQAWMR